jgi:hypothetical protein
MEQLQIQQLWVKLMKLIPIYLCGDPHIAADFSGTGTHPGKNNFQSHGQVSGSFLSPVLPL